MDAATIASALAPLGKIPPAWPIQPDLTMMPSLWDGLEIALRPTGSQRPLSYVGRFDLTPQFGSLNHEVGSEGIAFKRTAVDGYLRGSGNTFYSAPEFTHVCRFRSNDLANTFPRLYSVGGFQQAGGASVYRQNSTVFRFSVWNSGSLATVSDVGGLLDNKYHTVVFTGSNITGDFAVYRDGVLVGSQSSFGANYADGLVNVSLMGMAQRSGFELNCSITAFSVYNRVLSADEVQRVSIDAYALTRPDPVKVFSQMSGVPVSGSQFLPYNKLNISLGLSL